VYDFAFPYVLKGFFFTFSQSVADVIGTCKLNHPYMNNYPCITANGANSINLNVGLMGQNVLNLGGGGGNFSIFRVFLRSTKEGAFFIFYFTC